LGTLSRAGWQAGNGIIFTIVINSDAGISNFSYHITMRIEMTDTKLEIRVLAGDDDFMVATRIIIKGWAKVHSWSFAIEPFLFQACNSTLVITRRMRAVRHCEYLN